MGVETGRRANPPRAPAAAPVLAYPLTRPSPLSRVLGPPPYAPRVRGFLAWPADAAPAGGDPLTDPHGRDFAARDHRAHLKTVLERSPATANTHLVALDHFFTHPGPGPAKVGRDEPSTTRRCTLPARADLEAAVSNLPADERSAPEQGKC